MNNENIWQRRFERLVEIFADYMFGKCDKTDVAAMRDFANACGYADYEILMRIAERMEVDLEKSE